MKLNTSYNLSISILLLTIFFGGCNTETKTKPEVKPKMVMAETPSFNADSAYLFIEKQVSFGPRIPNTEGHRNTKDWLVNTLQDYTDTMYLQEVNLRAYDNTMLASTNIIGSINPSAKKRILLGAHWDTRPYADQDTDNIKSPIVGANDGGSGVGVLIEVARLIDANPINIGVDIILFDSEDYGQPAFSELPPVPDSYCLGSQYWSYNTHIPGYDADFGILLDMVGAKNALFTHEGTSAYFAKHYLNKVWGLGRVIGYSDYFSYEETGPITDDHLYVNRIANIPMIDIIEYDRSTPSGFGHYWHTHKDDMSVIDKNTLKAVGQTVLQTVYQYDSGNF